MGYALWGFSVHRWRNISNRTSSFRREIKISLGIAKSFPFTKKKVSVGTRGKERTKDTTKTSKLGGQTLEGIEKGNGAGVCRCGVRRGRAINVTLRTWSCDVTYTQIRAASKRNHRLGMHRINRSFCFKTEIELACSVPRINLAEPFWESLKSSELSEATTAMAFLRVPLIPSQ